MLFSCIFGSKRDSFQLNLALRMFHVYCLSGLIPVPRLGEKVS